MKQPKKLTLTSIKIKSFATSLSLNETTIIKGGISKKCGPVSNNDVDCTNTTISRSPNCLN